MFTYHVGFDICAYSVAIEAMSITYAVYFQPKGHFLVNKSAILVDFELLSISSRFCFYCALKYLML